MSNLQAIPLAERPELWRGVCSVEKSGDAVRAWRYPAPLLAEFAQPEGRRIRSRCTAGVRLAFRSDTRELRLALRYGEPVPWAKKSGLDLVVDGDAPTLLGPAQAAPGDRWADAIFTQPERQLREFVLWLPHLTTVDIEALEVEPGCRLEPLPAPAKRWLSIGDSITQGFVTDHPSRCYAALAAQALGMDHQNAGVGGGRIIPGFAMAAEAVEADLITVALGINDYAGKRPLDECAADARTLLSGLRRTRPAARIVWITPIPFHTKTAVRNDAGLLISDYARMIREVAAAVGGVETVDGYPLLPDEAQWFVDNCHPNDAGHELYARNLAAALAKS